MCHLSERTIRDWRREKFSVDLDSLYKLCNKTEITFPEKIEVKNDYWYTAHGSPNGGLAVFKKYGRIGGDQEYRKKKWYEWWEREGKYKSSFIPQIEPIRKPRFSKDLAEFIGIVLGDGSIGKSQITITLHNKDDEEYIKFVIDLIKKLFDVLVGVCRDKKSPVDNLNISRSKLIRFCTEKLGLVRGNKIKQQVDIPEWIKQNGSYSVACVRGLIDTDGSVFTHNYKVNGKVYSYKKLSFTSYSKPLRQSVFDILKDNSLKPRMTRGNDVRIDSIEDMKRYFKIFGSSNPKHLSRYYR